MFNGREDEVCGYFWWNNDEIDDSRKTVDGGMEERSCCKKIKQFERS